MEEKDRRMLTQAAAATEGWVAVVQDQLPDDPNAALVLVRIRACENFPTLRNREYLVRLRWRVEGKARKVSAYDEEGGVLKAWKEGQERNPGRAPEPHLYDPNGNGKRRLCLGLEIELEQRTETGSELAHFLKERLTPYLALATEVAQGTVREGQDRPHDLEAGYWEWASEALGLTMDSKEEVAKQLLEANEEDECPCGSTLRFSSCHGMQVKRLRQRLRTYEVAFGVPTDAQRVWDTLSGTRREERSQ